MFFVFGSVVFHARFPLISGLSTTHLSSLLSGSHCRFAIVSSIRVRALWSDDLRSLALPSLAASLRCVLRLATARASFFSTLGSFFFHSRRLCNRWLCPFLSLGSIRSPHARPCDLPHASRSSPRCPTSGPIGLATTRAFRLSTLSFVCPQPHDPRDLAITRCPAPRPLFLNRTPRLVDFRGLSLSRDPFLHRSFYPNGAGRSSLDVNPLQGLLPTDSISRLHDIALS